ncbi:MAG TPA: zf-TFIIB domain-containing protein [Candidatus Polarisedimenticolia bacterium]|nr:zf-TFIIB domain-containing protein [Candidatus Polarisedimenticolia bacterium]
MDRAGLACPSCGAALDPGRRACAHCGMVAATRRCGACLDLNLPGDRNCRRCGKPLPADAERRSGAKADCPGCGAPMSFRTLSGLPFDECESCGGLWLTPAALREMTGRAEERSRVRTVEIPAAAASVPAVRGQAAVPVAYRRCPSCRRMMNRTNYAAGSGLVLDLCKEHGVYFDHGEVSRLFEFIESGGLAKARRREEEAAQERLRDARRQAIAAQAAGGMGMTREDGAIDLGGFDLLRWIAGRLFS